jgi:hypothetical protein
MAEINVAKIAGVVMRKKVADGMEIRKDIRKLHNVVGSIVVAVEDVATMTTIIIMKMIIMKEADKATAGGSVIRKDIRKLLNAVGEIAVEEIIADKAAMMKMIMITNMNQTIAAAVKGMADGLVIRKDIRKHLNADGAIVAKKFLLS